MHLRSVSTSHYDQGATWPDNCPGHPRRDVQACRGAEGEIQIYLGVQFRLILRADLPVVLEVPCRVLPGVSFPDHETVIQSTNKKTEIAAGMQVMWILSGSQ